MSFPWGIIIALLVLGLAVLIQKFFSEIIEEKEVFLAIIGVFLAIYIAAAAAVGSLNPLKDLGTSSVSATADTSVSIEEVP